MSLFEVPCIYVVANIHLQTKKKKKFFFCLFRAAPMAYGGSQARGLTGAKATGHSHSAAAAMWDPRCVCDPHHSSQQCWILNPPCKARG